MRLNSKITEIDGEIEELRASQDQLQGELGRLSVQTGVLEKRLFKIKGIKSFPGFLTFNYFHEFFADLFAAVYHNDPHVIGDAFEILDVYQASSLESDARRFTPTNPHPFTASSWSIQQGRHTHEFFTPARAALNYKTIADLNERGLGREFLRQVLERISDTIIDYTLLAKKDLFHSHANILKEIQLLQSSKELGEYLTEAKTKQIISSDFVEMDDLISWCSIEFDRCASLIQNELKKGTKGIFLTSIKMRDANLYLIKDLAEISSKLLN